MAEFDLNSNFIPALAKPSTELPIAEYRDEILCAVSAFPVTIIIGQTGCGKTTQIPQFLRDGGWCDDGQMVAITQPRRVAAMTVAMRVADEVGGEVGDAVGYAVRFDDQTSPRTRIKFMTDGTLLREMLMDPLLERYSVIMVDEAHERTISTDLLLAMLKRAQQGRPALRIIVSSATLQAQHFFDYFSRGSDFIDTNPTGKPDMANPKLRDPCISLEIEGRQHPVDIHYLEEPTENYVERAVETVFDIHKQLPPGDILVFLTGRDEIVKALDLVSDRHEEFLSTGLTLMPLPMYAGLTSEQQMFIFDKTPSDMRKVVFATNIAEASVTIDGVVYVVDCGIVKLRAFDPATGIEALKKAATSKASARQRAGRAGRTRPGKCFRLYPEHAFDEMEDTTSPEIMRSNLTPVMLQLMALGVDNVVRFDYVSPPPSVLAVHAMRMLYTLGAITDQAQLARPLGMRMAELPVEPMAARALLAAHELGVLDEVVTVVAMASLGPGAVWFYREGEEKKMKNARKKYAVGEGDHLTLYNAFKTFVTEGKEESRFCRDNHLNFKSMQRAVRVRAQLVKTLEGLGVPVPRPRQDDYGTDSPRPAKQQRRGRGQRYPHAGMGPARPQGEPSTRTELVLRALAKGFFANAARMQPDGSFRNVDEKLTMWPHPSSLFFNETTADWVVYHEAVETKGKIYLREVSAVRQAWLVDAAPGFYRVVARRRTGERMEMKG